jgi:hypothetical protein
MSQTEKEGEKNRFRDKGRLIQFLKAEGIDENVVIATILEAFNGGLRCDMSLKTSHKITTQLL